MHTPLRKVAVRVEWFTEMEDLPLGAPGGGEPNRPINLYGLGLWQVPSRCYYDWAGLCFMLSIFLELQSNICSTIVWGRYMVVYPGAVIGCDT